MKSSVCILFMILFASSLKAQVVNQVIASSGGYNTTSGVSLSWTLGETVIPTFVSGDGNVILSHGFQQKLIVTAIKETIFETFDINVYPNPASEILNIRFGNPVSSEICVEIHDTQGRIIKSDLIEPAMTEKQIFLQDLAAGIYYLRLKNTTHSNVYKVVKL